MILPTCNLFWTFHNLILVSGLRNKVRGKKLLLEHLDSFGLGTKNFYLGRVNGFLRNINLGVCNQELALIARDPGVLDEVVVGLVAVLDGSLVVVKRIGAGKSHVQDHKRLRSFP